MCLLYAVRYRSYHMNVYDYDTIPIVLIVISMISIVIILLNSNNNYYLSILIINYINYHCVKVATTLFLDVFCCFQIAYAVASAAIFL
jgi:hypothetical protein